MKILVIQQKMIGDVLTSSILFEALRQKYAEAELHYLIHKHTLPIVENNPFIDKFILFDPEIHGKSKGLFPLLKQIRKERYQVVIDVYAKINTALITAFSGAPVRISYYKKYTSGAYSQTFEPAKIVKTNAGLAIENRMLLLQALSADFQTELKPRIYLTEAEKSSAKAFLKKAGISEEKPLFMISILGSSRDKTYPLRYMAQTLDLIVDRAAPQLLFNYMPSQQEEAKELYKLCSPETQKHIFYDVYGKSLREFMAITSQCNALIGNEGGAVNTAKALNIPTFAIFSPWIKREAWTVYEDHLNAVVHLADYKPELFKSIDEAKKQQKELYEKFEPALFSKKIMLFLKEL